MTPDPLLAGARAPEDGPGAARRAVAAALLTAALLAAVVLQLTVVNRLPLPGSAVPDLVLLLVTAIAVATGPAAGALAGFVGGLAVDVAPPAEHYAGEYALVFCLAGWGAAWAVRAIRDTTGRRDPLTTVAVMAAAAAAGEAGKAALALLLSEPDVTGAAASRVLPAAICYDLLLAPLAYGLVAALTRGCGTALERAPRPEFSRGQRLSQVFRQASAGAAPGLRLAGSGADYHRPPSSRPLPRLRLAGSGTDYHRPPSPRPLPRLHFAGSGAGYRRPPSPRPLPRLHLAGSRSPAIARTGAADSGRDPLPLAGQRRRKLNFSGDLRASARGGALAARPAAPSRLLAPRPGWLGRGRRRRTVLGSGVSGNGAVFRRAGVSRRNWYTSPPSRAWLRRSRHPWRKRRQRLLRMVGVGR